MSEYIYHVSLDDLLAFAEHTHRTSARAKRTKFLTVASVVLCLGGFAAQYYYEARTIDWVFILLVLSIPLSSAVVLRAFRNDFLAACRRFIDSPAGDTGMHQLFLDPSGLREVAPERETQRLWDQLRYIEETQTHLFVFDEPRSGFIIPRGAFSDDGVYRQMRDEILAYARGQD